MATIRKMLVDVGYDIEGSIDEAIEKLARIKAEHEANGYRLEVSLSSGYDGEIELEVYGTREETAEEIEQREKHALESAKYYEDAERRTYEALKAKYGA